MSKENTVGYAGDLLATDAFRLLSDDSAATLVDVRTRAEWAYVGAPDLTSIGKSVLFLEWQNFPTMLADPDFAARLTTMLQAAAVEPGAPLLFLCRSGARSRHAAVAVTRLGRATERARYAATAPSTVGLADDVGTVRSALIARADRGQRWRARLLPASLRRRGTGD